MTIDDETQDSKGAVVVKSSSQWRYFASRLRVQRPVHKLCESILGCIFNIHNVRDFYFTLSVKIIVKTITMLGRRTWGLRGARK